MQTLISKNFISDKGKVVKIRVEYAYCQFNVTIDINNEYVSKNSSFATYMRDDEIHPHLDDADKISEINNKLIELNNFINDKLKTEES